MRAAIYARVSTDEQVNNTSISNQLEKVRGYCASKSYEIAGEYVDPGFSGTSLKRPELEKLMIDANAGRIDIILVYKLDRFFRSSRHMHNTIAELDEMGVKFASVTEPFDTSTAMGKAYLGMASTFAEWERNTFVERSRDGIIKTVQNGRYSGGIVTYGFQLNPDTKKLDVDESEADIVRRMYHWLNEERMTAYSVAARLNAMGVPTKYHKEGRGLRGKATANKWSAGRVYNMLCNPAYKGTWQYGKRSYKKTKTLIEGTCPPIVDETTYDKALHRFKENNRGAKRNSKRTYLLRGLIKCDLCGHSYCGYAAHVAKGEKRYYRCNSNGNRGNLNCPKCDSLSVPADLVEEEVWRQISELVQKPKAVQRAMEKNARSDDSRGIEAEVKSVKERLHELKQSEDRLLDLYADDGRISKDELDRRLDEKASSRQLLEQSLHELQSRNLVIENQKEQLDGIGAVLKSLRQSVKNASLETQCRVIEALVAEIRVGKTDNGDVLITTVYVFDERELDSVSNEIEEQDTRLGSARMSLRLSRRSVPPVQLLTGDGLALPAAYQRPFSGPRRYLC